MADTRITHTETVESCAVANSRHVHGTILNWLLFGAEALHNMQHSLLGSCISDML